MVKKICNDGSSIFPYIARLPNKMHKNLPIIILLHGAGERGDGSDKQIGAVEVHGFSHIFNDDADIDCILIQPQCRADSFWVAHIQEIKKFIENMVEEYEADVDRVYLTGLSMGGYGTWFTAMAFPDMFAAIAPVCGGGMPWFASNLNMPVWAFHGALDTTVLPSNSIDMINALKNRKNGKEVKFDLYEDVAHNAWSRAYSKELLDWLLSYKRG